MEQTPAEMRPDNVWPSATPFFPSQPFPTPRGKGRVGRVGCITESALSQNGAAVVSIHLLRGLKAVSRKVAGKNSG